MSILQISTTDIGLWGQLVGTWPGGDFPAPPTPYVPTTWGYLVVPTGSDPTLYDANAGTTSGWDWSYTHSDGTFSTSVETPLAGDLYLVSNLPDVDQFPDAPAGYTLLGSGSGLFSYAVIPSLRFMSRQVHRTVAKYVEEKLTELGWVNPPVNFGAIPLTFQEAVPDENGKTVAPNTVSITIGDVGPDSLQELGGGYYLVVMPIFIDIYGQSAATAQSIADDAKEQVSRNMIIPVYNWTSALPLMTTSTIEFENVVGPERPPASAQSNDFRKYWRIVKAEAHVYYEPAIG